MSINFKKLVAREDWERALSEIIDDARTAVLAKDADGISDAVDLLNKFIDASPPEKPWFTELDDHARDALGELAFDIATASIDDLASRAEELRRINKAALSTAADNNQTAASIRHDKLVQALTSAMDAAKAALELQAAVKDNAGDGKIADAAQSLFDAISKFKNTVSQADSGS